MGYKRKETVKVIGELIAAWKIPFVIDSIIDNGSNSYTLNTCNTYYLQSGKRRNLTINSISYVITEVINNESVTIKGTPKPPVDTFNLPVPKYYNGTIIETNKEIKVESDITKKTPMIFLRRPFTEKLNAEDLIDSDIANKAPLVFYFLTEANFEAWSTAQHDINAILPMRNLVYAFIDMLKANAKFVERLSDYEVTDLIKFGLVTQEKGYQKGLFSDNYSGAQLDIELGIKYQCMCD